MIIGAIFSFYVLTGHVKINHPVDHNKNLNSVSPSAILVACSWLRAIPHLRQGDSGRKGKKAAGVNQLWAPTC